MMKLYGTVRSRASRCLWALEELGLGYEHVPVEIAKARSPEHLRLNPNGHIPVLDDDGLILWESMAINLYLAERYGKNSLWPTTVEDRGRTFQWSFWGMTELEPHLITVVRNRLFYPPEQRDEKAAERAIQALSKPLHVLDRHLESRDYILDGKFTIADLNVAGVLSIAVVIGLDLSGTPRAAAWLNNCLGREASQKVRMMK